MLNQAVILCGGMGTRLRPITNSQPKPMVDIDGRPFLYHLLKQLSDQSIKRFVLLVGYLGEQIIDYFGDGDQFGWTIAYSQGPVDWDTGQRFWEARSLYDYKFLLLYSDNFVQFDLEKLIAFHKARSQPISLLLTPKLNGNIQVLSDGIIQSYDKLRSKGGHDFVEVGYMVIERDRLLSEFSTLPRFPELSFSAILEKLSLQSSIAGLVIRSPYHSISDPNRLDLTREFLKGKKIILIDRDGTINEKAPSGEYITRWSEFKWIDKTRRALVDLAKDGFKFIIITNQAGIARKMVAEESLKEIHLNMTDELAKDGVNILKIYISPDHWNEKSFTRKPEPGLFFQASKDFNLRLDHSLYIGDDVRDCEAAWNAGCGAVYLSNRDSRPIVSNYPKPFFYGKNLLEKLQEIKQVYIKWGQ